MPPGNALPLYGNEKTMNLNSLVLANIQASPYFKHQLYELKTYHQVIDEIYYKVNHLEPWEKGSRKTAGQTGMCGGVRGVGTGGIVSSAYCLLYKLYTLKLTRKQVIGLCSHADSSFIRALGLMYIRYTQPPHTFWEWYEAYLDDEEEVDPKAGGGNNMTIGEMAEQLLVKLEWYGTLFPRIPVPVQKDIEMKMRQHKEQRGQAARHLRHAGEKEVPQNSQQNNKGGNDAYFGEAERMARLADREMAQRSAPQHKSPVEEKEASAPDVHRRRSHSRSRSRGKRSRSRDSRARRSRDRSHERRKESRRRSRSRSVDKKDRKKKSSRHRSRSRSRDRKEKKHHKRSRRSSSRGRHHNDEERRVREDNNKYHSSRDDDFQRDLNREMERVKRSRNGVDCK